MDKPGSVFGAGWAVLELQCEYRAACIAVRAGVLGVPGTLLGFLVGVADRWEEIPQDVLNAATLTEAFRRAVLRMFVKRELMDVETVQSMLAWPHSGFRVHDAVWAAADDKEFAVRLARYCARNPIALGRMEYDEQLTAVTYHSDKPTGPTAGSETTDAPKFLARLTSHIPSTMPLCRRQMSLTGSARTHSGASS